MSKKSKTPEVVEKTKQSKTKPEAQNKKSFKQSFLGFLWSLFWKGSIAFIALMLIAGIYFDEKIERKLDGPMWTLPAQVYARPLLLTASSRLSKQALIAELKLLNYRPVVDVQASGQFAVNNHQVLIYKRAFNFADRYESAKLIAVNFSGERLLSISDENQQEISSVRLDPLLLERLASEDIEDRVFIPFEQIPNLLVNTLLLMEDRNFYHHQGISPVAIIRAFMVNFKAGKTLQGGSTLTQQLAKNLFLSQNRSLWRKFQEAYIALLIDYKYSKDKILEAYLNEVYLAQNGSSGIYGIELASDYYFARPINELRIEQIALLVAIIKGPSYYNPHRNPKRALKRRDLVLRMMLEHNLISVGAYKYAVRGDLHLSARSALNHRTNPAFVSLLRRELQANVAKNVRKRNGLFIFTSIDPFVQKNAELAVAQGIDGLEKKGKLMLQGAMVVSDRKYAEVLALVSGKEVKFSGFNRALDAKRPIGSLVKPVVYLTALEGGFALDDRLSDKKIVLKNSSGQRWSPKNYDRKFRGDVSFEDALIHSLNVPTVNLGMQVGLNNVINSLYKMGVTENINAYPSLVLGSVALSPFQVAQLYQPITMSGVYQPLSMIRAIVSKEGQLLYQRPLRRKQIFSQGAVTKLTDTLHKVTTQGTARSLTWRNRGQYFSGKTGTTNNLYDSWFVGFDAEQVVTTWVGRDDNKSAKLTGSSGALILFSDYMNNKKR
ncbi:MAG: penicillin-binding protein 1B [Psychromonas sp.]|jgi:penicillin-binding protein 1B|uniref:penicillin-binding protein 1B n=1 Tax=Psychromonas sp. TaxID=1884585 RepID=UPI0039E55DCF